MISANINAADLFADIIRSYSLLITLAGRIVASCPLQLFLAVLDQGVGGMIVYGLEILRFHDV